MTPYTTEDLYRGAGAFDQAMRSQNVIPGYADRLSPGTAIGILSAAMRSGLPVAKFESVIDSHFAPSASLLRRTLAMYDGNDWSFCLWDAQSTGKYKLCTALCQEPKPSWQYNLNAGSNDW